MTVYPCSPSICSAISLPTSLASRPRFTAMAILCCCPQLIHKRRHQIDEEPSQDESPQGLPTHPPAARLPAPVPHDLALSPQSTAARSSLTNPLPGAEADASVHLAELVLEDSEDYIVDDELAHTNRNRSTSTLEAVKARIRRHLSLDSIPGQSESEEQIARRAEVKRLMRKRIQEELQNENNPSSGGSITLQHPASPSVTSATVLGNGPRDTIEFTVDEATTHKELAKAKPAHLFNSSESGVRHIVTSTSRRSLSQSSGQQNRRISSRPVSLRNLGDHAVEATESGHYRHVRHRSSLPEMPISPHLQPVRAVSLHDSASLASWRLSFSADRLAELLTPDKNQLSLRSVVSPADSHDPVHTHLNGDVRPSQNRLASSPPATHMAEAADKRIANQNSLHSDCPGRRIPKSSSLVRDESPVGLWLRAQSQQFRLCATSPLQSEQQSDSETDGHCRSSTPDQGHGVGALHTRIELSNSPRCSGVEAYEQRATSAVLVSDVETVQNFPPDTSDNLRQPRDLSPAGVISTPSSHGNCQKAMLEHVDGRLQNVVRKGFAGIRLPSFRCELIHQPCIIPVR